MTKKKQGKEIEVEVCVTEGHLNKTLEIEILQNMSDAFKDTDTYLASLFTQELVNWATEQIRNDFPPDIFDFFRREEAAAHAQRQDANEALTNEKMNVDDLGKEVDRLKKEVKEAEQALDEAKEETAAYAQEHMQDNIQSQKAYEELATESTKLCQSLDTRDKEVLRLKAEVYDLRREFHTE